MILCWAHLYLSPPLILEMTVCQIVVLKMLNIFRKHAFEDEVIEMIPSDTLLFSQIGD